MTDRGSLVDQIIDVAYARGGLDLVKDVVAELDGVRRATPLAREALDGAGLGAVPVDVGPLVAAAGELLAVLPASWRARPEAGRVARALADLRQEA